MILQLSKYRAANFNFIKTLLEQKEPEDFSRFISECSLATSVPVICVCYFVGEMVGFDKVQGLIDNLKIFYQVTEVIE